MKVKIGCFFAAILASLFSFCYAQTGSSVIRGSVFIQNNKPAEAATVVLLNLPDSTIVMSALVNNTGAYQFTHINPGKYVLFATMLGSNKTYSQPYNVASGQTINITAITLAALNTELKEVAIIGRRPYIEVRPDKTIINPAASIIADGQSVLEVLRQSPGVRVDNNDNVSISGRQDALVLIDGKATNLSGADLSTLLKGTQAGNIDRIEILKNGSAKYDAAAGGVVNIVYKKGKNLGTNGTYNASVGYGRYYKASTGVSFNTRTKVFNLFGSYSINGTKTFREIHNDRGISYAGVQSSYSSIYKNIQESQVHNFRLGTDFFLSANQSIGFLVSGIVNNNDFDKNNTLKIANRGVLDSIIVANSTIDRNISNINYNVNYTGKLDKTGRTITANITHTRAKRQSAEYITNEFFDDAGAVYRDPLLLQNISPTKTNNWTALLEYSNPLPKSSKFDAGLKFSRTQTDNNFVFGPQVNGVYTINPAFSNRFLFIESIAAAYADYNGKFGKFDLDAGLRGEYTDNKGTSVTTNLVTPHKYFNLFPTILLNYRYNDKNEYALSFTRGINRPSYDKLNPFIYFVDLYNYQAGNPYLQPQYNNKISLSHTYNREITTSLYANLSTGATFPFYQQNDASKISLTTEVNLGRAYTYGININAPLQFTEWWTSNYDIDASYQRYIAYARYGNLNKGTGDLIISSAQDFKISKTIAAQLSGKYETATFYGINQYRPTFMANAGISKDIFHKLGKLSITANDIFKTYKDRIYTNYQNLNLRLVDLREYRKININFSYRFGRATVKGAAGHVTGNEDVQSRMSIK
ncbi:TonB-dependent receptor [Mucilaginibacter rigui]|uniref:TonB-dependent receptor n=1 Tax=Mucilaginibacter rigui TaxID=534635 RepID=A0ABR7WZT9_9SPHI|nr:outer membrane beta-barrel protein [Mucilaginibacter rigui]MBD1383844.1 TonB-dependent receptor [Mucilaginibacter rigui]